MLCRMCHQENGLLIKGKCSACDPVAHKRYLESLESDEVSESEDTE